MAVRMQRGSGNVFRDLGFPADEAAHLLVRTDLMIAIRRVVKQRKLTQARTAKLLGITQPRVSDLLRGRIDLFSIDALVDFLARLDVAVSVRTSARKRVA